MKFDLIELQLRYADFCDSDEAAKVPNARRISVPRVQVAQPVEVNSVANILRTSSHCCA